MAKILRRTKLPANSSTLCLADEGAKIARNPPFLTGYSFGVQNGHGGRPCGPSHHAGDACCSRKLPIKSRG